ncbi:MAG: hypothetical protein J2O48_09840 [Solirubrobacterales bacterium]|nr:hypothetical protein [Solirubrobacterales bacterium]
MPVSHLAASSVDNRLSDEVELYQRTYTTLLRSSGEMRLRVLEQTHRAMGSSLHPLAGAPEPDLGAFIYAVRRLPLGIAGARQVVLGQELEDLVAAGLPVATWTEAEAPARRRRWYDGGEGVLGCLIASQSDVDDLIPTLVAYQIEWNKLHAAQRGLSEPVTAPQECAKQLGGTLADWERLQEALGEQFAATLTKCAESKLRLGVRMLGGSNVGYARLTRRWWAPVAARLRHEALAERPLYFVSSNTHSLANIVSGIAREREPQLLAHVESLPDTDILSEELQRFRAGESRGSWENFLYASARGYWQRHPEERQRLEQAAGVTHLKSHSAVHVPAQIMPLSALSAAALDPRLGDVSAAALANSEAVIVNIDYPLGLAAYNILREVAVDSAGLRGIYVLGKAATLNADVGDVMISSVIHDEHSRCTYWLDNTFSVSDLAADLRFGTGLDNQRAVTVKSTFLQNRSYLDFYYREAFTVVEMEAGPFCSAVYELSDPDRHPTAEAINFSKLGVDLGIIHYASDTPYTQARTLGARGLDYYGMDSTYAASLAIMRRILALEGALT